MKRLIEINKDEIEQAKQAALMLCDRLNKCTYTFTKEQIKDLLGLIESNDIHTGYNYKLGIGWEYYKQLHLEILNERTLEKLDIDFYDCSLELQKTFNNKVTSLLEPIQHIANSPHTYYQGYKYIIYDVNKWRLIDNVDDVLKADMSYYTLNDNQVKVIEVLKDIAKLYNKLNDLNIIPRTVQSYLKMVDNVYLENELKAEGIYKIQ